MDNPTEYISKESIKKRISDLKLRAVGIRTSVLVDAVEEAIIAIPAADAVEVVRCGKCVKFGRHDCVMGVAAYRSGFCSEAERKDGDAHD